MRLVCWCLSSSSREKGRVCALVGIFVESRESVAHGLAKAVPGARLYTNEINMAVSRASKSSRPVLITGPLRQELEHWLFLFQVFSRGDPKSITMSSLHRCVFLLLGERL